MLLQATKSPIFECKNTLFVLLLTRQNLADNAVVH